MTYLVLVRHGESIWHALWTKESQRCRGAFPPTAAAGRAPGGYRRSERGGHHGRGRWRGPWVGFPLGWGRPVLSSQRSP